MIVRVNIMIDIIMTFIVILFFDQLSKRSDNKTIRGERL